MRHVLLLASGLALLSSCENETPTPASPAAFSVNYNFINQGDANVQTVFLLSDSFFPAKVHPGQDTNDLFYNTYDNIKPTQKIRHISYVAGTINTLYPGCVTYMEVTLKFRHVVYTPFPATDSIPVGGYRVRKFALPTDTVTTAASCIRTFSWPADTLKYPEQRFYK